MSRSCDCALFNVSIIIRQWWAYKPDCRLSHSQPNFQMLTTIPDRLSITHPPSHFTYLLLLPQRFFYQIWKQKKEKGKKKIFTYWRQFVYRANICHKSIRTMLVFGWTMFTLKCIEDERQHRYSRHQVLMLSLNTTSFTCRTIDDAKQNKIWQIQNNRQQNNTLTVQNKFEKPKINLVCIPPIDFRSLCRYFMSLTVGECSKWNSFHYPLHGNCCDLPQIYRIPLYCPKFDIKNVFVSHF